MEKIFRKLLSAALSALLLAALVLPGAAADENTEIRFLSYEEALACFDFDKAASNWCTNFGLNPETKLADARAAIIAGTNRELIIRLATFARDTGHGDEKLVVSNAFRPACYQEIIGLHDSNSNTGSYYKAMKWNGYSVNGFWWDAENQPGWPRDYAISLADYDIQAMDMTCFYRAALRLWDNTWVSNYYAKPGCSAHNSGCAVDLTNYWIATNFATSYTYQGVTYAMEDYGLYKPLQPSNTSAGETWHITCSESILALGNYDTALENGYEIVYGIYYNPASRGWAMSDGRGAYLGAGVAMIQLQLCRLGLLGEEYITGFFCSETERAAKEFQTACGLEADGICGTGTLSLLFAPAESAPSGDSTAPVLLDARIESVGSAGFLISAAAEDDGMVSWFRVETRAEDAKDWVSRRYNARRDGTALLDVDIWAEGSYEVRVSAGDAFGNECAKAELGSVYVDATPPRIVELTVSDITPEGFSLAARAEDLGIFRGWRIVLQRAASEEAEESCLEFFQEASETGAEIWRSGALPEGEWSLRVTAVDSAGNENSYSFLWTWDSARAEREAGITRSYYGPAEETD